MKIYAYYLPQFHQTKENDEWWGTGFTEWDNIKNANALFQDHYQPRIPLHKNYYNLLEAETMAWQGKMAAEYGVDGFCVYHYWFEGKLLLNMPMEKLLQNKGIAFPFFFCWANETWTNSWAKTTSHPQVLMEQTYGDKEEWERHFMYLLPFFQDNRYIKESGKPLLVIYRPENIPLLNERLDYYNRRAQEVGFTGICFMSQQIDFLLGDYDDSRFTYKIEYQPGLARRKTVSQNRLWLNAIEDKMISIFQRYVHKTTPRVKKLRIDSYDEIWEGILKAKAEDDKRIPGAFVGWDNTPRYVKRGSVIQGSTPEKFYHYLKELIAVTRNRYQKDMIFIFAWNEWTEGGYLEPDEKWGYGYLEAIKKALEGNV